MDAFVPEVFIFTVMSTCTYYLYLYTCIFHLSLYFFFSKPISRFGFYFSQGNIIFCSDRIFKLFIESFSLNCLKCIDQFSLKKYGYVGVRSAK